MFYLKYYDEPIFLVMVERTEPEALPMYGTSTMLLCPPYKY